MGKKRKPLRQYPIKDIEIGSNEPKKLKKGAEEDSQSLGIEDSDGIIQSDNDSEQVDSDNDEAGGDIKVEGSIFSSTDDFTFEFHDMKSDFVESITVLLKTLISNPTEAFNIASVITRQEIVGTSIVCEGCDDVFAFATIIPIIHIQTSTLHSIIDDLSSSLPPKLTPEQELFSKHLVGMNQKRTGLFIHRKFSNLPLALVEPLHRNLLEDLNWAKGNISKSTASACITANAPSLEPKHSRAVETTGESEGKNEANDCSFFEPLDHVVLICPCRRDSHSGGASAAGGRAIEVTGSSHLMFDYFEDDIYFQQATCVFHFTTSRSPHALAAMLLPLAKLKKCVDDIKALIA